MGAANGVETSLQNMKRKQYHRLNIAFSLMTVIPFLVFLYILATRLFSFNIVIGDIGLTLSIILYLSFLGYWLGYSIVHDLFGSMVGYAEELKRSYDQLEQAHILLVQAEKFKSIGQLASGVAHEVKNPLGIILQCVSNLEDSGIKDENVLHVVSLMKESIHRADNIINALADFSKSSQIDMVPADINSIIESSLLLTKHRVAMQNAAVVKIFGDDLPKVPVDSVKMEQVFINIFLNSAQAMPGGGRLSIRTFQKKMEEAGFGVGQRRFNDFFAPGETAVVVEIEDTGTGIPKENLKMIFDPFFTTRGPGGGTGLGLSVTRNIVELHKGLITIDSEEGKGTKVTIILKTSL